MSERSEERIKEERTEKSKKKEKGAFSLYRIQNGQAIRLRPTCERCGPGYFMANHVDRYTCGHCGFTRYKLTSEDEK